MGTSRWPCNESTPGRTHLHEPKAGTLPDHGSEWSATPVTAMKEAVPMFDRKNDTRQGDRLADKLEAGPDGDIDSCLAGAIEALETYGHHHAVCAMRMRFQPGPPACTCGYDPKLRALKGNA